MAVVSAATSLSDSPHRKFAISHAASCGSGTLCSAAPRTMNRISSSDSSPPSRFLRIRSIACIWLLLLLLKVKAERKQLDKGTDLVTGVAGEEHHRIRRDEFAHHL